MLAYLRTAASRLRAFLRPEPLDQDFMEELESHLAMAEEDKIRQGMTPAEARRQARIELGRVTQVREAVRDARGLPWLDTLWLDIKLSLRMLRKSWGLTLVGGLAMTLAMVIGVIVFAFLEVAFGSKLPLDEGQRVVVLQVWDSKEQRRQNTSLHHLEHWRSNLRTVRDVGAFRVSERNLVIGNGVAEPVELAEMTASGFQLARVQPLLGRTFTEADELNGAAPVAVIGYNAWQSDFSGDSQVVGQVIQLGGVQHTVVGVMPQDFEFPINHQYWIPLRSYQFETSYTDDAAVMARLAPGVHLKSAQAEIAALGLQLPSETLENDALQPQVEPFIFAMISSGDRGLIRWVIRLMLLLVILLLVPPCANIAILVYARTITRQEEFAARYALGASRGRIVGQLFIEMWVLAVIAAGVALGIVQVILRKMEANLIDGGEGGLPFWMDFQLSPSAVLFAGVLTVCAALTAGLIPALKATGRQMQLGLHALGKGSTQRLGTTWTALVVLQVALSLAALPAATEVGWGTIRKGALGPGFEAEDYLTARLTLDSEIPTDHAAAEAISETRLDTLHSELVRQLDAEPGVRGVTLAALPGDEPWHSLEIDKASLPDTARPPRELARVNHVDEAFFEVFEVPLLTGRGFEAGDFDAGRNAVLVNRTFVDRFVGDGNPLGRRVRYATSNEADGSSEPITWYEIVGVVADLPDNLDHGTLYHPRGTHNASTYLALHLASDPNLMVGRLREITTALDPNLRLEEIASLDAIYRDQAVGNNMGASFLGAAMLTVLLLSAAGMYALTSFTVNRRRREIGIRSALGASSRNLLFSIFKRTLSQLSIGAVGGVLVASLISYYLPAENLGGWSIPGIIPTATAVMVFIGVLAAVGPARRGLRVDPLAELREG